MRASLLAALVGALAGAVLLAAGAPARTVEPLALRVAYWKDGARAAPDSTWTLRCNPPRGTLPRPGAACRRLARGGAALFAPTPPGTACSQIYGGPQKARVIGVVGGKRVWTVLTRRNGCEIARWNRLAPWLLPPGGMPS